MFTSLFPTRTRASLAACATLAALGLAAAPAVHAAVPTSLTLNNGDAVTVDGTGTHGTINNTTSSYNTSSSQSAVLTSGTAAFTLGTGGSLSGTGEDYGLNATGSGPITITGGSISNGQYGLGVYAHGTGSVTITGGSISTGAGGTGVVSRGSASVTIMGGTITAGTGGYGLYAQGGSFDLYGMFDGYATGNITLPTDPTNGATGSFTGTLQNNTASQLFTYKNTGTITLHNTGVAPAPEPSQFAAFAVGLLGLGALAVKARKRYAA